MSNSNDQPTVFHIPRPGGGRSPSGRSSEPRRSVPPGQPAPRHDPPLSAARSKAPSSNPLEYCGQRLLSLAYELRSTVTHGDPEGLRTQLADEVIDFVRCARERGTPDNILQGARYVLCALVDEAVRSTPWGNRSSWAAQGLLTRFHNDAAGGERFFEMLDFLKSDIAGRGHLDLMELQYYCLALGFQGRYAEQDGGQEELDSVRGDLFEIIRGQRGDPELDLSPHWRGVAENRDPLVHYVPLWVLSAVASVLLLALFAGYLFSLSGASDPSRRVLASLHTKLPDPTMPEPDRQTYLWPTGELEREDKDDGQVVPAARITLRQLLAEDAGAGTLDIEVGPGSETVHIRGGALFRSASAAINDDYQALLTRVGEALAQLKGRVVVVGHTDSSPISTLRFPSNWELSEARAETVAGLLRGVTGQASRFTARARADTEPIVKDDPSNPLNRRVEITLYYVP